MRRLSLGLGLGLRRLRLMLMLIRMLRLVLLRRHRLVLRLLPLLVLLVLLRLLILLVLLLLVLRLALPLPRLAMTVHLVATGHLIVGRGHWTLTLIIEAAVRLHDAVVVLGVLVEIFRRDAIAGRTGFARHGDIALEHLVGVAADLHARSARIEVLTAMRRAPAALSVLGVAAHHVATATPAILLAWSHESLDVEVIDSSLNRAFSASPRVRSVMNQLRAAYLPAVHRIRGG